MIDTKSDKLYSLQNLKPCLAVQEEWMEKIIYLKQISCYFHIWGGVISARCVCVCELLSAGSILNGLKSPDHFNVHILWLYGHHGPGILFSCCSNKTCCPDAGASSQSRSLAICQSVIDKKKSTTGIYLGLYNTPRCHKWHYLWTFTFVRAFKYCGICDWHFIDQKTNWTSSWNNS